MKKIQEKKTDAGMLAKLRSDLGYRRKLVLTLSVFLSYVILGWAVLQIGTALPDIQQLITMDLETAAWIFTVWSVGFVFGSLVSGRLLDRWDRLVIMMINTVAMSGCCFSIPYCRSVTALLITRFLSGVFAGGIDTGANTIVPTIWDSTEGRSFMQAMYLAYTLGAIFSPLATKPFMAHTYILGNSVNNEPSSNANGRNSSVNKADGHDYSYFVTTSTFHVNSNESTTSKSGSFILKNWTNYATDYAQNYTLYADNSKIWTDLAVINFTEVPNNAGDSNDETRISCAFIMTGIIVFLSAIPFAIMSIIGNYDIKVTEKGEAVDPEEENLKGGNMTTSNLGHVYVSKRKKLLIIGFVAGVNFVYSAIEDSLGDFLTTYCLFHLQWTTSASVSLMSFYWVMSCVGGFTAIFIIKLLGPVKLLFLAFSVWNISFLIAVIGNIVRNTILTWIGFLGAGSAMVSVIPAIISWTNDNICEITGKVSSVFMVSTGVGIATNPKFIGYMMEEYSYGNFIYILTCETVVCTVLFLCAIILFSCSRALSEKENATQARRESIQNELSQC